MTQEQDIVERLLERSREADDWTTSGLNLCDLLTEAAQTIAALRAERDELKEHNQRYAQSQAEATASCARRRCATKERDRDEAEARAEAAETRVKELGGNVEYWKGYALEAIATPEEATKIAIRERDELQWQVEKLAAELTVVERDLKGALDLANQYEDERAELSTIVSSQRTALDIAIRERDELRKSLNSLREDL